MNSWAFAREHGDNLDEVLSRASLDGQTFAEWASVRIAEAGLTKGTIIQDSMLNPTFAYQILAGQRNAKRNKLLQLAFGMNLSIEDTSELLERGGTNALSPRNRRDIVIAFCRGRNMTVPQCDQTLADAGLDPLRDDYPNARRWMQP